MNSYTILAKYYDKLNTDCDYDKWSQYLYSLIKEHSKGDEKLFGADGACGSGGITIKLVKAGLNVYGFDISEGMLNAAMQNAADNGVNINFLTANLTDFKVQKKLHFLTAANDAVNYIGENKLLTCFKNAYNNLRKNGIFLFDISSAYKLENIIADNTFFDDKDGVTFIWNNTLTKGKHVQMDLIFFVRQGTKYLRFDENHIQYIYQEKQIVQLLKEAGFAKVAAYDFLTKQPPHANSKRIQFTAEKN